MKNTEYKDMFDFGAEALSMDHAFSTTQFPSLKNTFTIGEQIEKTKFDENRWQPKPPKLENGETVSIL